MAEFEDAVIMLYCPRMQHRVAISCPRPDGYLLRKPLDDVHEFELRCPCDDPIVAYRPQGRQAARRDLAGVLPEWENVRGNT